MTPVTSLLTVTLFLPGVETRPAVLEFAMPDVPTCEAKGRALVRESDEIRRFEFVCEARS